MTFTFYNPADGKIICTKIRPESDAESALVGELFGMEYLRDTDGSELFQYVVSGELVSRPINAYILNKSSITADEIDEAIISGIPDGAELFVNKISLGLVSDGAVELTADIPGNLAVRLVLFPYLDYEVTINAS